MSIEDPNSNLNSPEATVENTYRSIQEKVKKKATNRGYGADDEIARMGAGLIYQLNSLPKKT